MLLRCSWTSLVGPLPSPPLPPNIVPLTPMEQLGKFMVFDVTPQKEVVWKYKVPGGAEMRQVRGLSRGNTLICASSNHVVLEVNPAKEIVWKCELPFPYLAQRLPNGNTLISSGEGYGKKGWYLIEVDSAGKTIWKYGGDDAPDDQQLR